MSTKAYFKDKWLDLSPGVRTAIAIGGLFAFLILVGSILLGGEKPRNQKQVVPPSETNLLLPKGNNNTPEELSAGIESGKKEIKVLKAQLEQETAARKAALERLDQEKDKKNTESGVGQDLLSEVKLLQLQVEELKRGKPQLPDVSSPLPGYESGGNDHADVPKQETPALRITGNNLNKKREQPKKDEKPAAYITAGAFFEGILLNGMDAPTSATTQKNPVPTTLRIKTEAMLPNNFKVDLKECFALASGYGVLSSERAMLRTETLSCVTKTGKVIEGKMEGYIVGEDGRVGMRGRLVSKQGQMIAKTIVAGGLSGLAQALTPQQVPRLNLNPGNTITTQTADASSIAQTGVAKGFSTAANEVAKFYLEMAREMTPVVEVDAGRKATIVLVKGIELK